MEALDRLFCEAKLLLHNLGLDPQVGQLIAQPLVLYTQCLALLFSDLDLLVQQHRPLDGDIVLGLQVLQRRRGVAGLPLKVVVLHFDVPKLQLQGPLRVTQGRDLFLKRVLGAVGLGPALLVLGLPLLHLEPEPFHLLL